eukprot:GILJ01015344.1.p1 GENE.GILJ01015344.1~~GILJ01015344.1.p1  ORF type:complete len:1210 (+),score=145.61 GILJ01015344.1:690-4319(+)
MVKVVLVVGPPLVGKGTTTALWASRDPSLTVISTGQVFRQEIATGTELGLKMKSYMDNGQLVPDELTTEVVRLILTRHDNDPENKNSNNKRLVLDGYPRTLPQLFILQGILSDLDGEIEAVVVMDAPLECLGQRLMVAARGRSDDTLDIFHKRYSTFQQETGELVRHVGLTLSQRLATIQCAADTTPEGVLDQVLVALDEIQDRQMTTYQFIERRLLALSKNDNLSTLSDEELVSLRDRLLAENAEHRTGANLRRFVYLKTSNMFKYQEHVKVFDKLYGIEVLRLPPQFEDDVRLLTHRTPTLVPLAVIREETNLLAPNGRSLSSMRHGVSALDRCTMTALTASTAGPRQYECTVTGHVDLTRQTHNKVGLGASGGASGGGFGWDDIFVPTDSPYTYHQLATMGIKNSSRQSVISDFLRDVVYYKTTKQFAFSTLTKHADGAPERVVDFRLNVADLVNSNASYNHPLMVRYGLHNMFQNALNGGMFWRRAENRRQNTYWCPGLNGGMPVVRKPQDAIHEDTYRAHDLGHHVIPDLIFDGEASDRHRRAYIAVRMASEACTLIMGDVAYVDKLKKSGVVGDYDFGKRCIYPLFCDLGISFDLDDDQDLDVFMSRLKTVMRANFDYCLKGDDSGYRQLLVAAGRDPDTSESLARFKAKYKPFFVEDFRWTERNFDNMVDKSEELALWWNKIRPLRGLGGIDIQSISDFCNKTSPKTEDLDSFLANIFEYVFEERVRPAMTRLESPPPSRADLLFRGFTRWMAGQLAIMSRFVHVYPELEDVQDKLIHRLVHHSRDRERFSIVDIDEMRAVYEQCLQTMVNRTLISKDDMQTFKEVYPLFDPFYMTYDHDASHYEDLDVVSRRAFNSHMPHHIRRAQRHNPAVSVPYLTTMITLVEAGDGQVLDGLFVTRPGVLMLTSHDSTESIKSVQDDNGDTLVSFLIAGISVETSLELTAHKEAKVARLTSSKTRAMSTPLYRVQGRHTLNQRIQLSALASVQLWNYQESVEIQNMTRPACKSTAICYSMTVKDFHTMFIGRMNTVSNETEVVEVVERMAVALAHRFPTVIRDVEWYRHASNLDKGPVVKGPNHNVADVAQNTDQIVVVVDHTRLTAKACRLFQTLGIHTDNQIKALCEFRSRLTFLAFNPTKDPTPAEQDAYLTRMTKTFGHLSILDAVLFVLHDTTTNGPKRYRSTLKDIVKCGLVNQVKEFYSLS